MYRSNKHVMLDSNYIKIIKDQQMYLFLKLQFARDDPSQFVRDATSQSSRNRSNSEAAKIAEIEKQKDEMVIVS